MTGFKSKREMAQEDDDIQDYVRPWVGLTDQEIADLDSWYHTDTWRLIKETEAKLKHKNT